MLLAAAACLSAAAAPCCCWLLHFSMSNNVAAALWLFPAAVNASQKNDSLQNRLNSSTSNPHHKQKKFSQTTDEKNANCICVYSGPDILTSRKWFQLVRIGLLKSI